MKDGDFMKRTSKAIALLCVAAMPICLLCGCGADMTEADSVGGAKPSAAAPAKESGAAPSDDDVVGDAEVSPEPSVGEDALADDGVEKMDASEGAESGDSDTEVLHDIPNNGEALVLTAGEWNDHENWGFFTNLVKSELVSFPSYGLNPTGRIAVTVEKDGAPARNQKVNLLAQDNTVLWSGISDKNGKVYLFYTPETQDDVAAIQVEGNTEIYEYTVPKEADSQGSGLSVSQAELTVTADTPQTDHQKTEVMFILDTTGSMGDEIAYLQKDFTAIAEDAMTENITYSVNFYRDETDDYVTKCNPFTNDLDEVQSQLNQEYASGGGDEPEAVAEILEKTMINAEWSEDSNKIAFLIFDAPPHEGTEESLRKSIETAAAKGIHLVPVVASNGSRETELFGRAAAIMTNSNYVFLTDDSGVGSSHLEPIIGNYDVELLHDIIVRNIQEIAE